MPLSNWIGYLHVDGYTGYHGLPHVRLRYSVTLTEDEWAEIAASGLTIAAFLKERMKKAPAAKAEPVAPLDRELVNYPRHYFEERWDIFLKSS